MRKFRSFHGLYIFYHATDPFPTSEKSKQLLHLGEGEKAVNFILLLKMQKINLLMQFDIQFKRKKSSLY